MSKMHLMYFSEIHMNSTEGGVNRGYAGVKKYVRGMLVDPQIVETQADFDKILDSISS